MKTKISKNEARQALSDKKLQAEELLDDEHETKQALVKAKKLLKKIGTLPVISKIVDDVTTTIELVGDSTAGRYQVPKNIIISALGGILYIVSPIDLIPDFIPVVGWFDDVSVFMLILELGLATELNKYRKWKELYGMVSNYENNNMVDNEYDE